jgi:tRNA A37 threonylcarbamoyladenosine dehydratase
MIMMPSEPRLAPPSPILDTAAPDTIESDADAERRFGGLARLYGDAAPARMAGAHVVVVGLGGVGSWTAEALARSGLGAITLIDLDHVSESNINRQIHALASTLGQSKIEAMAERIRQINPACRITLIDDFVSAENVQDVLTVPFNAVIDCADQASAKIAMILHARKQGLALLVCGGAGGKTDPLRLRAGDLSESVNDALLSKLRNTLRREHGFPKAADQAGKPKKRIPKMRVHALWFDQQTILPSLWTDDAAQGLTAAAPQGLSCAGYGSVVTVTAMMGLAAADYALRLIVDAD